MPRYFDNLHQADRYMWPAEYITPTEEIGEFLLTKRKEAVALGEFLRNVQKQCAKEKDYEGAKMLKGLITDQRKQYLAICFHLPWFVNEPPGDARLMRPRLWPLDLVLELDAVAHEIYLHFGRFCPVS